MAKDSAAVSGISNLDAVTPIDKMPGKGNPVVELDAKDNFKAKLPKDAVKPW